MVIEKFSELLRHRTPQLLGIHDRNGAPIIASHIVANADGDELHGRLCLDIAYDLAKVTFEVASGIDGQRRVVDRSTVGNHHEDATLLGTSEEAVVCPNQGFSVNVLLQ